MVEEQAAVARSVNAGNVTDVVSIPLQEADHRIFVAEQVITAVVVAPRRERPIVADLVCPAVAPGVEVRTAVGVVRLPGGVRRLEDDVGVARVVADDKGNLTLPAGVGPGENRQVHPGDGRGWYRPGGRDGPVSAVDQLGGRIGDAGRLILRQSR